MAESDTSGSGSKLNLGLSALVGAAEVLPDDTKRAAELNSSIDWIEKEFDRNVVPRSILSERLLALAPGLSEHRSATGALADAYKRLEKISSTLLEMLGAEQRSDFSGRFEAASREKHQVAPAPREEAKPTEPAPFVMGDRQSDWSKFAQIVKTVGTERETQSPEAIVPEKPGMFRFYSRSAFAVAAVILLILFFSYKRVPDEAVASSRPFVRVDEFASLSKISDDTLVLPSLAPLVQVSSLSSLASEIQANPLPTPSVRVSRNVQQQVPSDDRLEAIPVPAVDQQKAEQRPAAKEVLKIETSNEPYAVRDLQVQPEAPFRENTFDFPPFLNKPAPQNGGNRTASTTSMDGEGRPVTHFDVPRRYSITAATQVMSRPSYWAPRMGIHDPGDTVSVDAIIGVWLRIRDEDGNSGYILAQDAAPEMRASR